MCKLYFKFFKDFFMIVKMSFLTFFIVKRKLLAGPQDNRNKVKKKILL